MTISSEPPGGGAPAAGSVPLDLTGVRLSLAADLALLTRELDELALLGQQAAQETERHEARRVKGADRVAALERDARVDPGELREARSQLLNLSRRATLFEAQQQVLEGKSRTVSRFRDRLAELDEALAMLDPAAVRPAGAPSATTGTAIDHGALLRAQEELRRDIVRQMHDGPAQSLANIALQAEIVQRLASRGDGRAAGELEALRSMVQAALETTKEFIFGVRPMVLDDLGLVPTLRRSVIDRGRRVGVAVEFVSQGVDRRLGQDLESGLFRIIDEAVSGYVGLRPSPLLVRLDWSEQELVVTIRGDWPAEPTGDAGLSRFDSQVSEETPPALRAMIEQKLDQAREARTAARSLPAERLAEISERARILGIALVVRDDGAALEMTVRLS